MSLVLNTNISSMVAQNNLTSSGAQLATSLQQLSSGMRINTAADDAAGYAIVQGMTSQINGIGQAARNANDGVSLSQTASGALQEVVNDLQTMRDLAVQSLNATNSDTDRADLDAQFQQLKADINSVSSQTQFNGVNLLDGSFQGATFQVGANAGQSITMSSISSSASNNLGQMYTAKATDPAAYTADGTTTGAAVAKGDAGTFSITAGGKSYTTASVTLTGNQTTDLKTIAAVINQATGAAGIVATVDTNGKGINLSSTTAQTIGTSYTATTGTETTASFGLNASTVLTAAPQAGFGAAAAATGDTTGAYTTALGTGAGHDTVTLTVGATTLAPITLTGNRDQDLQAVANAVTGATGVSGVTAAINANGGIDFTSTTNQTLTVTAAFSGAAVPPTSYASAATTGGAETTAQSVDTATVAVTIGANTYTATQAVTGNVATGTKTDADAIVASLNTALAAGTGGVAETIRAVASASGGISFTDTAAGAGASSVSVATTFAATAGGASQGEDGTLFGLPTATGTVNIATGVGGSAGAAAGTEALSDIGLGNGTITMGTATTIAASPSTTLDTADVKTVDDSNKVLIQIDAALQQLATTGAQLGAYQNRFQAAVTGLNTDATNLTSARSQIQDTDYASATSALSKAQILQQASTAMVAQANTIPQNIMTLLQKLP